MILWSPPTAVVINITFPNPIGTLRRVCPRSDRSAEVEMNSILIELTLKPRLSLHHVQGQRRCLSRERDALGSIPSLEGCEKVSHAKREEPSPEQPRPDVHAAWPSEGPKSDSVGRVIAGSASPSSVRRDLRGCTHFGFPGLTSEVRWSGTNDPPAAPGWNPRPQEADIAGRGPVWTPVLRWSHRTGPLRHSGENH